ncbi:MAG: mechanosensitive ion channel [Proteobacteria bacterium]|nr:mechanosensitive ion channel [Pseudomonadota bacterium]MBU1585595.1 mechanosensitive ion channel [Pseudomonadota bacterium]MBU2455421.1 mechanosensitive ion channel [Pseudomonadota bacterium]MBU2631702.1 mechanosensitive ion channel [Pseudomonadota bacterium]
MNIEKLIEMITYWVTTYSVKLIVAILIFLIGKWLAGKISKILTHVLEKSKVDITLIKFLENIIYYTLMIVIVIAAAGQMGINTTSFLTIVGAAGLAIGLALKDSLSNFASGVMLIMFRPYRVGDVVNAGGVSGKVVSISLFNTILNTPDNQKLIVPNSSITSNVITNVTANDTRRVDLVIGIGYDDDIKKTKDTLNRIVREDSRILDDPKPTIAVSALADSSVNFVVRPWVKTSDYWDVYFDLTEKIKITFDKEGISIPYPQQDVHLYKESAEE